MTVRDPVQGRVPPYHTTKPRLAYHVLYPGEDPKRQADNFLEAVGGDWLNGKAVLDLELDHAQSKDRITNCLLSWCDYVQAGCGHSPIIYSRAGWVNDHTLSGSWRDTFDWWLANYLYDTSQEKPPPPILPTGVTKWLIHQNADHYPSAGYGIATKGMDTNRWNGDAETMLKYFDLGNTHPVVTLLDWANAVDPYLREKINYSGVKPPTE